ncbi:MAG: flagellar basal body P-ring formation protein FlgA [Gammaproteobacteria bacterium]|nr:flagellar basal body P-ring formation protein FlgA [Gammaproteobacteria bacterium]
MLALAPLAQGNATTASGLSNEKMTAIEIQAQALEYARNTLASNTASGTRAELSAAKIDPRLAMRRCSQPLAFEPQKHSARGNRLLVKVRCNDAQPWAWLVPLNFKQWSPAVVAVRPLARGHVITAGDLEVRDMPVQKLAGAYLPQTEQAIGMVVSRNIAANTVLSNSQITAPKLVKRGDAVAIVARAGSVQVRMAGTALADGKAEQQIRVKNQHSQRVIKARVVKAGLVEAIM